MNLDHFTVGNRQIARSSFREQSHLPRTGLAVAEDLDGLAPGRTLPVVDFAKVKNQALDTSVPLHTPILDGAPRRRALLFLPRVLGRRNMAADSGKKRPLVNPARK